MWWWAQGSTHLEATKTSLVWAPLPLVSPRAPQPGTGFRSHVGSIRMLSQVQHILTEWVKEWTNSGFYLVTLFLQSAHHSVTFKKQMKTLLGHQTEVEWKWQTPRSAYSCSQNIPLPNFYFCFSTPPPPLPPLPPKVHRKKTWSELRSARGERVSHTPHCSHSATHLVRHHRIDILHAETVYSLPMSKGNLFLR